jgi:multidrug resistance efflux pump
MKKIKISKKDIDHLHLRADDLKELIGVIPKSYLRYGIPVIFLILLIILLGCWFFKYPDIVNARVEITANNLPVTIVARSNGRIAILVKDNQLVERDKVLAVIENTADFSDVMFIKDYLNLFQRFFLNNDSVFILSSKKSLKLGDIQAVYSNFLKQYADFNNFVALNYHKKKISIINIEIKQQGQFLEKLKSRLNNSKEQLTLAKNQFSRDSLIFQNGVIALSDFEKSRNQYLQQKNNYELANNEIINSDMQITRLNQMILDLESQKLELTTQQRNALKESYDVLLAQLANWEKAYLLKAPVKGEITFTRIWNDNQNIKTGDVVFTIVPKELVNYIAKIKLPIQSSGKVKPGQHVIIKLDDFPYMEFGFLQGKINKISLVTDNDFYFAEILFPSKLETTYHRNISMRNELRGNAEVITKDERLLMRFMYPLKALFNRNAIVN